MKKLLFPVLMVLLGLGIQRATVWYIDRKVNEATAAWRELPADEVPAWHYDDYYNVYRIHGMDVRIQRLENAMIDLRLPYFTDSVWVNGRMYSAMEIEFYLANVTDR